MASKFVKLALSIAAFSPLFFSSLTPANAEAVQAKKPAAPISTHTSATQMKKTITPMSTQVHPKNVNATKPMGANTAASKSTTLISYSPQKAPILRLGSQGKAVRELQSFLKTQKLYNGAVNGVYSRNTRSAVIAFQKSHNLKADGVVGAKTWSAIVH
ncbi:peptidoglycan-binding domain-containing protein [Aliinostoc sp. HNIBRCY26]|uniref:peptidoglycan-binding domain-containing protein n=1 Tax=Aliinostoc sp. HNIBRCY26 TaxID=3418997 RepID=UPI003D02E44A